MIYFENIEIHRKKGLFKRIYKYIATSPPLSRRPRPWTRPKTRGCPPHIAAAWLKSYETKQPQKKTVFVEKEKEKKSPDKTDPEQNRPLSVISSPWISRNWRELAATTHKLTFTLKLYFAIFRNRIFIIFRSEQRSFAITVSIVATNFFLKKCDKRLPTWESQEVFTNLPYSLCPRSTRLKQRCCADFPAFPIVRERG